ncbi:MAG: hypothetical protein C7B43_15615 [Sulfobacillus benefaciens]|uniref:CoA-binding domain-containing protein n=1 Tax=Sulfobacillus benefaciens TaxID=453960 RepID=A0A2T2WUJ0_9FIRM|nr:MAG: hypothetical protein C7B43_15615 [Sulfobacillus benefaciens]
MHQLLSPRSLALVGVSPDTGKIAGRLLPILDHYRYQGPIYPVNPLHPTIGEYPCYPGLADLPEAPEVAAVLVPRSAVVPLVQQAVQCAVPYVVIFISGFAETRTKGVSLTRHIASSIQGSGTRVLGPNSEGFFDLQAGVPLSFSPIIDPIPGRVPLPKGSTVVLSQSGGLGFAISAQLANHGVGIRAVMTTGNELDLDLPDFIRYYANVDDVRQIVLFLERAKDLGRWSQALHEARQRGKSVWAVAIGQSPVAAQAISHHTGTSPVHYEEFSALFQTEQIPRLDDMDTLIDAVRGTQFAKSGAHTHHVAILTASGGGGIWCADLAVRYGLDVSPPSEDLANRLRSILPP